MSRRLGLDLGGTNIKVVVLDGERVEHFETVPTYAERGPAAVVDRLVDVGRSVLGAYDGVEAVGIGVPGLFDAGRGTIQLFPNLPGPWRDQPMRDPVAVGLGRPVTLSNDARAFTLAEGTIGAGRGSATLVCVTLGTGIGGGIMFDGRLYTGPLGVAGEIAHQTVVPDGPLCGCGNRGCAEAVARADVIAARARRASIDQVYAGVAAGDLDCVEAVEDAARHLGIALANAVVLLGPDRIVIGGGIAQAGEVALEPIRQAVRARVTLVPTESIEIVPAALGVRAGAVGAALAAQVEVRAR
jgi:glucokinase